MIRLSFALLILLFYVSCSRSVSRVAVDSQIDLSGRWNDSDSRMVAEEMIKALTASENFKAYSKEINHKPVVIVGAVLNKTSEHIDADNYIKKIEAAIFNSGAAEMAEGGDFRDKIRQERTQQQEFSDPQTAAQWGKETGADLMLLGEMTSETDVLGSKRVVHYITTLFLTSMETNKRIWYGQKEIKKYIKH
ncbi:MAG: penicillin-binding protein activator LpoB [Candidatus Nephrothrix sp. EaCA]|nr:MAG: penicillin-binding protein activator LpoB [Candidatus Nephrothrix sp. EaCA]